MELIFIFELICYSYNFYACKGNTFVAMMQEKKREKYQVTLF